MAAAPVELPENHRRRISITLTILDEALCRLDEWADGRERRGPLYRETNTLSREERRALRTEVADLRRSLEQFRDTLSLQGRSRHARVDVWSQSASLRQSLIELESKRLRGYGDLAPAAAQVIDEMVAALMRHVERVAAAVRSRRADRRRPRG